MDPVKQGEDTDKRMSLLADANIPVLYGICDTQ